MLAERLEPRLLLAGAYVDLELLPVMTPTADLDGTPDTIVTLPSPAENVPLGSDFYLEVWVKDVGTPPAGISGGYLDISYDTSYVDAMTLAHGSIYTTLISGTINDLPGLIDEFGGGYLPSDSERPGIGEYSLLGRVTFTCTGPGMVTFTPRQADDEFSRFSAGAVPWDQIEKASVSINIDNVNHAPVLDNIGSMTLTPIDEDTPANSGTLVTGIIASADGDRITDVDAGALEGIAVIGVDNTNGTWQYSTNNGSTWTNLVSPSASAARLLRDTDKVRFQPNANYNGTVTNGITFRAWDRTSGTAGGTANITSTGGSSAFSSATETAGITVNPVNDAPTLTTIQTLTGATRGYQFPISYEMLAAAGNEADCDSGQLAFRVESISSGTLTKDGAPAGSGTLLQPGQSLVWLPPAGLSGTLNAFTVKAWDGALASSTAVQVKVVVSSANLVVVAVDSSVNQSAEPGTLEDWTATVKNNGPGWQRADWTVEWYLSSDTTYQATDTLIGSQTYSSDYIAPGASVAKALNAPVPSVPLAGQKYVIARVVNAGPDGVATNNAKASLDKDWFGVVTPTVIGSTMATATDLGYVAGTFTRPNQSLSEVGQKAFYKFTTLGPATTANSVRIDFTHTEGDLYLKLYREDGTQVGATANTVNNYEQASLNGLPEGTYYVEVGANNGDISRSFKLTVVAPAGPDLTPKTIGWALRDDPTDGTVLDWTASVRNNGSGQQRADWTVQWYFSADAIYQSGDALIGIATYSDDIGPAGAISKTLTTALPTTPAGTKYVIARVSTNGPETTSVNNTAFGLAAMVSITAPDALAQEGLDAGQFVVTRAGSATGALTVYYSVAGTAANAIDYERLTGSVTIPDGATSAPIILTPKDDLLAEPTETALLTLVPTATYSVNPASKSATLNILDNESTLSISSAPDNQAAETIVGDTTNTGTFRITRDHTQGNLTVYLARTGTAMFGTDYTLIANGTNLTGTSVVIPDGQDHVDVTVAPVDDLLAEATETVNLTLTANTAYRLDPVVANRTATVNVLDLPRISINDISVKEGDIGQTQASFTVRLGRAYDVPISFDYSVQPTGDSSSATPGVDFIADSGRLTFQPGQTSLSLPIAVIADTLSEPNEQLCVLLTNATTAALLDPLGIATILNDDYAPSTINGRTIAASIRSGTYPFASSGSFQIITSTSGGNYVLQGGPTVVSSWGTFSYVKTGSCTATATFYDSATGTGHVSLTFTGLNTASYVFTNDNWGGMQTGTMTFS